jgi:hypothetical protein
LLRADLIFGKDKEGARRFRRPCGGFVVAKHAITGVAAFRFRRHPKQTGADIKRSLIGAVQFAAFNL